MTVPMIVLNKLGKEGSNKIFCYYHFHIHYVLLVCNKLVLCFPFSSYQCGLYLAVCEPGSMLFCCQYVILVLANVVSFSQKFVSVNYVRCYQFVLILTISCVYIIQFGLFVAVDSGFFICVLMIVNLQLPPLVSRLFNIAQLNIFDLVINE